MAHQVPSGAQQPQVSTAEAFALVLETACGDFETLQALIKGELSIHAREHSSAPFPQEIRAMRASATVRMALAKSFVFNVVRAGRICEHGAQFLDVDRGDRVRFLKGIKGVLKVRDVNEHGYDPKAQSGSKDSKPSMHAHVNEGAILDETSMTILSDQKILMGPLNLCGIYSAVARMRHLAGFASLRAD
jgi:hypothetical protein